MKTSSQPGDDSRALRDALAEISSVPRNAEQERFHKQATDTKDAEAVKGLRDLVHGDFARLGQEAKLTGELSPEQQVNQWFTTFEERFDAVPALHRGILREDVVKSLRANPEAIRQLMAFDAKGHNMNVFDFDKETGEFIFASAWENYNDVAEDHRSINFDAEGQKLAKRAGYKPNGNAVSIIAKIMGIKEDEARNYLADTKLHDQLGNLRAVNGWAWLKTDAATREAGYALGGCGSGVGWDGAYSHSAFGSLRAALRVKKV